METINDRMETIVNDRFNGNKAAFSKAIGVAPAFMSSYLGNKRRSKPNVDIIVKIIKSLNIDPYWLLTGEKNPHMLLKGSGVRYNGVGNNNNNTTTNNYHYGACEESVFSGETLSQKDEEMALLRQQNDSYEKLLAEKDRSLKAQEFTINLLSKRVEEFEKNCTHKED